MHIKFETAVMPIEFECDPPLDQDADDFAREVVAEVLSEELQIKIKPDELHRFGRFV